MTVSKGEHALVSLFARVAAGFYPPFDGLTEVKPRALGALAAIIAFTGHVVVAADVDPARVSDRCPPGDLLAPVSPGLLVELGDRVNGRVRSVTLLLVAAALVGDPDVPLQLLPCGKDHPRVRPAMRTRRGVRIY